MIARTLRRGVDAPAAPRHSHAAMLNAYFDFDRGWIACAIVDGQWIESNVVYTTWRLADEASEELLATRSPHQPKRVSVRRRLRRVSGGATAHPGR